MPRFTAALGAGALAALSCSRGSSTPPLHDAGAVVHPPLGGDPTVCRGASASPSADAAPQTTVTAPPALTLPADLALETLASVPSARELAALPNGDLLVATEGSVVYLVPRAEEAGLAGAPLAFATLPDGPAQGILFAPSSCTVYVATSSAIYALPYVDGQTSAAVGPPIAKVRTGPIAPNSDGDVHVTTSLGFAQGSLFAGVGSSCNACTEADPTRATIQQMAPDGSQMQTRATRFRNAIAFATNPRTGTLWSGGAGQDGLPTGHPYEFMDAVTSHPGIADYGWPSCEENHTAYQGGADCAPTVAPLLELPAYSTLIGAVFYPDAGADAGALPYALPATYRGALLVTAHGAWHQTDGRFFSPPRVVMVAMNGDAPVTPVDWTNPERQWTELIGGFQLADGVTRVGRPTGIAVGARGSLFVADDQTGLVYRVRPR
jgi:glucose/arabinose dehydrogenase